MNLQLTGHHLEITPALRAFDRVDAGPGAAGGHQETDRDGGDEAPQHFMRVPGQAAQRAARQLRREYPQRDGDQRPQCAGKIERAEAHFEEGIDRGRVRRASRRFVDGKQDGHVRGPSG